MPITTPDTSSVSNQDPSLELTDEQRRQLDAVFGDLPETLELLEQSNFVRAELLNLHFNV